MSWLRDITSGEAWTSAPGTTAAKALGCVLFSPFCVAGALTESAQEVAQSASERVNNAIDSVTEGGGDFLDGIEDLVDAAGYAASDTAREIASIMKWAAIALFAVTALAIVGLILFLFLKF